MPPHTISGVITCKGDEKAKIKGCGVRHEWREVAPRICPDCGAPIKVNSFSARWPSGDKHTQIPVEVTRFAGLIGIGKPALRLAVVQVLASYWWDVDRPAFPAYPTIADHLGYQKREIGRTVNELCAEGLIVKMERRGDKGQNAFDLSPLDGLVGIIRDNLNEEKAITEEGRELIRAERSRLRGETAAQAVALSPSEVF